MEGTFAKQASQNNFYYGIIEFNAGINSPDQEFKKVEETLSSFGYDLGIFKLYKKSFTTLAELHPYLIPIFSHKQLIKLATSCGGSKNLVAVNKNCFTLMEALGFNTEQIIRIAAHAGGSGSIIAVRKNYFILKSLGFDNDQMAKISLYGSKNVIAAAKNGPLLKQLNFNIKQIVEMLSRHGAPKILITVIENYQQLKAFHFTNERIAKIASLGFRHLETALNKTTLLPSPRLSTISSEVNPEPNKFVVNQSQKEPFSTNRYAFNNQQSDKVNSFNDTPPRNNFFRDNNSQGQENEENKMKISYLLNKN